MNGTLYMTRKILVIYKALDVVVVPFPFTDSSSSKKRPALVISSAKAFNEKINHYVLLMITSARNSSWPLDIAIQDLSAAGLSNDSVVRMKMFTLDGQLILKKIGSLKSNDRKSVEKNLGKILADIL